MKVYIIKGNNGEMYEDYYEWIEAIYLNKENAKKELNRLKQQARIDWLKEPLYEERQYTIEEYETKN